MLYEESVTDVRVVVREQYVLEAPVTAPSARGLGFSGVNSVVYLLCWAGRRDLVRVLAGLLASEMWLKTMYGLLMWYCRRWNRM